MSKLERNYGVSSITSPLSSVLEFNELSEEGSVAILTFRRGGDKLTTQMAWVDLRPRESRDVP
jgi:hypothetical protein